MEQKSTGIGMKFHLPNRDGDVVYALLESHLMIQRDNPSLYKHSHWPVLYQSE